jgi:glycerate 2-kinase
LRRDLEAILASALVSASASRVLERALRELDISTSVTLIAAGKAAFTMARTFGRLFPSQLTSGLVVSTHGQGELRAPLEWIQASHPVPDDASERAGRRALQLARSVSPDATLVVLLSGGASALLAVPADGVHLDDKIQTTRALLAAGAPIETLNCVRKHLSAIKGGQLAAACAGATVTFALSDVVGTDDPSVIGSGPTAPDPTTFADALCAVEQLGVRERLPPRVIARLETGAGGTVPDTPSPGDPRLSRARLQIVGSLRDAINGAVAEARTRGYAVVTIARPVVGEARTAARAYFEELEIVASRAERPICLVSGGETTVRVVGDGRGGRNQEFALALARPLASLQARVAVASAGTDGIDGPTDAAGAIVDSTTLSRGRDAHVTDPEAFLANNDSHAFFAALNDLIRTGPTDTNVGDVQVALIAK